MTRYLEAEAAGFRFLIPARLVVRVSETAAEDPPPLDLSRVLGAGPCRMTVVLVEGARLPQLGVGAVRGLVELDNGALAPLPARLLPACGDDVDAVTCAPRNGAHAFRLRLDRSSAAAAG